MIPRRVVATTLVVLGLGTLAARALQFDYPPLMSLRVARKFWSHGTATRLVNSVLFRSEPLLTRALLEFDARTPFTKDALLVLPLTLEATVAEDQRRRAAYVLAPRRVVLARGALTRPFELRVLETGDRP
jgi:hypothetical protein